jgi:hypothetical protein
MTRLSDIAELPVPGWGDDPPPAARGPAFALVSAEDGFAFALSRMDKRTLTICSSVDAGELLDATARPGKPRADHRPSKPTHPFLIQGMSIREMPWCSGAQGSLRSTLSFAERANCRIGRLRTLLWLWPPALRDRRQAISARQTMLCHPSARHAWLVMPPETAAAWAAPGWPVLGAAA